MDTVGLGVVGLGWFGAVLADSARSSGVADVVACYSRTEDTRVAFAEKHGSRAVTDLDEMLADPAIDGVLVATPHSTHADIAVRVAEAGKHVFVEKPLTLTVADTKRVAEAASRAGVAVQVGHNRRRQPANRRIKAMIDAGELGTILQLDGMHTAPGGHKPDLPAWRKDPSECPFGGMAALGVHTVDTFHYFIGPAKKVTSLSTRIKGFNDLDEATTVLLEYESGPIASINTTYFAPPVVELSVFGSDAAAWNEEDGTRLFTQARSDAVRKEQEVETIDTLVDEIAEFARSIRGESEPETGVPEAIEVAAVLEGIGRSLESGCAADLSDLR
ncbi:MAG TPA: Gfo/Idh/MocA family oxidoreductase [Actinomycetota bacterium]|nr:Gfo/Idh/MocA family oxidoreductase [Actinomycetota bacterium]